MKPTVYLDTTVPSYWLPQGGDPIVHAQHLLTRQWWSNELPRFNAFISQVVLEEIRDGDPVRAAERLRLVEPFPLLEIDSEVESAAQYYIEQLAMPSKDRRDAFHLALASVHEIDYLVTWNYSHLANASKRTHFESLNRRLHLSLPVICSPAELMSESPE